jgi:uncharacterized protein GlcG (DUF336 family)
MRGLSLAEANAIIEGTFAEAAKRNCHPLSVIVLDAGGRVKAFQKQDGCSLLRFEIAYGKAFASLSLNRSSRQILAKQREKPAFFQSMEALSDGPLFLEAGGQLIRDETGEIVGAVGATGDVNQMDDICAMAGIRAAGFMPDEDFPDELGRVLNIKRDPVVKDPRDAKDRARVKKAVVESNGSGSNGGKKHVGRQNGTQRGSGARTSRSRTGA